MHLSLVVFISVCVVLGHSFLQHQQAGVKATIRKSPIDQRALQSTLASIPSPETRVVNVGLFKGLLKDEINNLNLHAWHLPLLSITVGASVGLLIKLSRCLILRLENIRAIHSVWAPLIGSLIVSLLYRLRSDMFIGPTTIFSEKDSTFSFVRQIFRLIAQIITVGTGCALGFAGPAAEAGMTTGRIIGSQLQSSTSKRQLCLAGGAAAFAANFNTPLAGFAYAMEVSNRQMGYQKSSEPIPVNDGTTTVLKKLTSNTSLVFLATAASLLVCRGGSILNPTHALSALKYMVDGRADIVSQLPVLIGLGFLSGSFASIFRMLFQVSAVAMSRVPLTFRPLFGGLLCSFAAYKGSPQSLFTGFATLNKIVANNVYTNNQILQHLLSKIGLLSFTQASGLVGGLVAPSFFAGSSLGVLTHFGATKLGATGLFSPSLYAVVGAAGLLSAFIRAPITASFLAIELTKEYDLILPVMIVTAVANFCSKKA